MDLNKFWKLIAQTRTESNNNPKKQAELLLNILIERSVEEILEFDRIFDSLTYAADLHNLYDVAEFIGGGLGDSSWWDFRAWLVGQGQEIYELVTANPESLAEVVELDKRNDIVAEELLYIGQKAYYGKTGIEIPPPTPIYPLEFRPKGESIWKNITPTSPLEYEQIFRKHYPRVWDKFGEIDHKDY